MFKITIPAYLNIVYNRIILIILTLCLIGCKNEIKSKCELVKEDDSISKLEELYDFKELNLLDSKHNNYFHYLTKDNCEFKIIRYKDKILEIKIIQFSDITYINPNDPHIRI